MRKSMTIKNNELLTNHWMNKHILNITFYIKG